MKIVTLEEHIRYLLQLSEKYYSSSSGGKFDLNDAEYFVKNGGVLQLSIFHSNLYSNI